MVWRWHWSCKIRAELCSCILYRLWAWNGSFFCLRDSCWDLSVNNLQPLLVFEVSVGLEFFCLHLTSRHCPFFHTVSSVCLFFPTVPPSFSLAEFVCNCPTYCTCGESIAAYHHFSFQPLERNLKIFSWRARKFTTVTSTLWSTERQWVVCKYMYILIKFNLW